MKKFDEVKNILVDISWRFITVIIIDCIVFALICSCLISAIRSYNKNFKDGLEECLDNLSNKLEIWEAVQNNLKKKNCFNYRTDRINEEAMEKAINNKDIILVADKAEFDKLPNFNPADYGDIIETWVEMAGGVPFRRFLRVKKNFDLKSLISHLRDAV